MVNAGCDGNKSSDVGSVDTEISLAITSETDVFDRLSQCQTFSEIALG
jgi:hypothetical protein